MAPSISPSPENIDLTYAETVIARAIARIKPSAHQRGNCDDDDYMQEARIRVWKAQVRGGGTPLAHSLVYTIAYRAGIDMLRADLGRNDRVGPQKVKPLSLDLPVSSELGDMPFADAIPADDGRSAEYDPLGDDVAAAIATLKPRHQELARAVLVGLSWEEVARRTGAASKGAAAVAWGQVVRPKLQEALLHHRPQAEGKLKELRARQQAANRRNGARHKSRQARKKGLTYN